jgi:hypothetical protein
MKPLIVGRRSQVALTAALALLMVGGLSSAAQATNARSSSDPELCKNGGWQNLTTSTGAPFANQGDCVSYAAHGGELLQAPSLAFTSPLCGVMVEDAQGPILGCSVSIVGSGLMPGADQTYCVPDIDCYSFGPVGPDGTINEGLGVPCREGQVVTWSTTTAAGNPISASVTCSLNPQRG